MNDTALSLTVDIISPEAIIFSENADMLLVPGSEGDLGILPQHIQLMTSLRAGILKVFSQGELLKHLFVQGGFFSINQDHCIILVDHYMEFAELNAENIIKEIQDLEESLKLSSNDNEAAQIKSKICIAKAKLEASRQN